MVETDLVSVLGTLLLSNSPPVAYACHSTFGALHIPVFPVAAVLHNSLLLGVEDAKELVEPQVFLLVSLPVCPAWASLLSTPEKPEPAFLAKSYTGRQQSTEACEASFMHMGTLPGLP